MFSGKLGSPFSWIKVVAAFFHCACNVLQRKYLTWMILSMDNRLQQIINIWSNGHGEVRGMVILSISLKDSGDKLKGIFCSFNLGIKEEMVNTFIPFIHFNALVKQVVLWTALKDRRTEVPDLKAFLA